MFTKKALIREEGYPIGHPAPMYLNCECGQKLTVKKPFVEGETCPCGIVYDHHGWIVDRVKVWLVQIKPPGEPTPPRDWQEWRNPGKDSMETIARLALNKWLRDAGYQSGRAVFEPFTVMCYVAAANGPKHPNGGPMVCQGYEMKITPTL